METDYNEIDEGTDYVGYREAFSLIASKVRPVGIEEIPLVLSVDRIAAGDVAAQVSYPSADVSLKDGFAVKSVDVAAASMQNPASLKVTGSVFAGFKFDGEVKRGGAVKVCSGAPIPRGADAVVSGEFCEEVSPDEVFVKADAEPGRNILRAGGEVKAGATITMDSTTTKFCDQNGLFFRIRLRSYCKTLFLMSLPENRKIPVKYPS